MNDIESLRDTIPHREDIKKPAIPMLDFTKLKNGASSVSQSQQVKNQVFKSTELNIKQAQTAMNTSHMNKNNMTDSGNNKKPSFKLNLDIVKKQQ